MASFQKIVLISAVVILLISLIFIGLALRQKRKQNWPPLIPECPDYWEVSGQGKNTVCTNIKDLGSCPAESGKKHLTMNFNSPQFLGSTGLCNKYKWANNCKVSWDGVTYGAANPCTSI